MLDPIEYDIKLMLTLSPAKKLRWREILNTLYPKYKKARRTKSSFSVTLNRKLKRLIDSGDLEKEVKGHQQVFYFIPKKRQEKVNVEVERAYVFKNFDSFWDEFSLDQKKKIVRDTAAQQQLFIYFLQRISLKFLSKTQELLEPWISKLENPTEDIESKYTPEERKEFLKEFHKGRKELEKFKSEIAQDNQPLGKDKIEELLSLTQEFIDRVVPKYPGGWREAMMDLMRKAVEQETANQTN